MVTRQFGPTGLEIGDPASRPGPDWTAVLAAYSTVFIPLSSSLYSDTALSFFLWLKQMKELEQEKDVLLAGLDVVEQAKEWYQSQIRNVAEKQRLVGQKSHRMGHFPESSQIRQNFLLSKLNEVSRCLGDLISWDGMSYESSDSWTWQTSPSPPGIPSAIQRLKDQNDQRIQEVTRLRERVRKLEQERCALIEQLYNAGAQNIYDCSTLDSTFI